MPTLIDPPIEDRHDIGMLEGLGTACLTQETLEERGVAGEAPDQDLDGDLMAGLLMDGPVDRAHAATAQRLEDAIAPDPLDASGVVQRLGSRIRLIHRVA